jgi:hypothetical protein
MKHTSTTKFFHHNILTLGHLAIQETKKSMNEIEFFGITFLEGRGSTPPTFPTPNRPDLGYILGGGVKGGGGGKLEKKRKQ